MGKKNIRIPHNDKERNAFVESIFNDIRALEQMLEQDLFETDVCRIGAEQEVYLIKNSYRPYAINIQLLDQLGDEHYTTEHSQYNLEINFDPLKLENSCFRILESQLQDYLNKAQKSMHEKNGDITLVGILPTLRRMDLDIKYITPIRRYKALCETMSRLKGGPYEFRINGTDELVTKSNSTMFEGSNTSFQIHLQVSPDEFVEKYNLAQAITGPLLAAATNSPILLGKRLWHETRIALFQQSIDTRKFTYEMTEKRPRVSFGDHWIEQSVAEVYKDNISRHRVLLIQQDPEDAIEVLQRGKIPSLDALQIHNGTVYTWNRACYGITNGKPHLRIENRVLPAGPTVRDEVANAAFWIGMMKAPWPDEFRRLSEHMNFDDAKTNFIKAARYGLDTQFTWLNGEVIPADRLILDRLIPMAARGLKQVDIDAEDIDNYLSIIRERVESRRTGSRWMLNAYAELRKQHSLDTTLVAITAGMINRQRKRIPVHEWSLPHIEEAGAWRNRFWRISQIMTTDVFSVRTSDPVSYANHIMNWKYIRHVPVEEEDGRLVGIITARMLLKHFAKKDHRESPDRTLVEDIMETDPVVVQPDTTTYEAIKIMEKHKLGFLPVVSNQLLVGIVTEHDFMRIAAYFVKEYQAEYEEI